MPPGNEDLNPNDSRKVVPLNTWVLISNFKLAYNMQRRPDGTFDRHLHEYLDRKVPASTVPVDGVFSYDRVIDRSTKLLVRIYRPTDLPDRFPVIIFFHGGSFAHSTVNTAIYDSLCRRLLRHCAPAVIVSVDYRRSPEHRHPCAYEDGWAALKWVSGEPWLSCNDPQVFLAGDSSGGNIAHHVALRAVSSGIRLAGNILLNPMFGGESRTESELRLDGKYFVTLKDRDWYWKAFLPEGADRDHPACNPFGPEGMTLEGVPFPKSLVVVAGLDLIHDWQLKYVEGLRNAGHEVKLVFREKATIGFYLLPNNDHCHQVMQEIKSFVSSDNSSDNSQDQDADGI
ncbi:hypothetical protein J5N97_017632 [Dioscorea zingiberensis]|uniref:Alpha/beta hydrolase fold-3 domain-containing protein n=1 Tax=Dioscorea zingiberensis TaxID=325984 RepID=A0A9D5CMC4_9LILI|nr:hypothetical protein J5N97_017632 [Dioscorea zingiberensis]